MWVPGHSAEVYVPPLGRGAQGLLPGARAWVCGSGVAVGALRRYGVRYRVQGEGSHRALYLTGDDGVEVRQPCCAPFAMVYPDRVLKCHLGA